MHPEQAALSIVLTALSTAAGVVLTPLLVFLLLGQHIPVDVQGMTVSIMQIVIAPVGLGTHMLQLVSLAWLLHSQIADCRIVPSYN